MAGRCDHRIAVHPVYATFIRLGRQVLQVKRRQEREYRDRRNIKNALAMFTISDNLMNGQSLSVEERQEGFDDMIKLSLETARLYNIGGGV